MVQPLRIVVGDDLLEMREFLREVLTHMGHDVAAVAATGAELVERCREHEPDLVLTDIRMPDGDGIEAVRQITHERATPVILLSAYHDAATVERARNTSILAYLVKPIKQADLEPAIAIAMSRWAEIRQLNDLSVTDELTKLHNRRGLFEEADQLMRLSRRSGEGFSLFMFDLDGFKLINDSLGHAVGDEALRHFADLLRATFRDTDIIGRLGGDEFCVLARQPDIDDQKLLDRLDEHLERFHEGQAALPYTLAVSVGIAQFDPASPVTLVELMEQADQQMYRQKRESR